MTKKTIEIFRAGTHVAMDGTEHTFTDAQVQAIADGYDPVAFSAPAVVGHPRHDDPAYGWATALRVVDGKVVADLDQVDPAFAELVEKGRFKKVSAMFYGPQSRNNPKPGQFYLRHIGFLGAAAPGVSGLAPVAFAEGEDDLVGFSTDAEVIRPIIWLTRLVGRIIRRQRDQAIAEVGVEEANKLFPEWDADAPAEIAAELEQQIPDSPRFAEPAPAGGPTNADIAAAELASREAAVAAREQAAATRDAAFAAGQKEARVAEDAVFLSELVESGRLPPGLQVEVAGFCEVLAESQPFAFAEGGAPQDPRAAFKALLGRLGTVIRFDEIAEADGVRFASGQTADELASAARQLVSEARARGETLSVSAAMSQLQKN